MCCGHQETGEISSLGGWMEETDEIKITKLQGGGDIKV